MTIKKTGNFRASKRKMPTLSVPSRQGFLQLDDISVSPVEEMQEWTPTFSGSGGLVFTPSDALEARYCRVGHLLYVNMYARGPISGSSSQTIGVTLPFQVGAGGFTNLAGANNSPITYLIRNNSTGGFAPGLASLGTLPSNQVLLTNEGSTLWTVGSARIIAFQGFLELAYEEDYYKPTVKVDKLLESSFFDLPNQTTIVDPKRIDGLGVGSKNITTAAEYSGTPPSDNILTAPMLSAGAIVEYGSNADGEYTKYESGLLICSYIGRHGMNGSVAVNARFTSANLTAPMPVTVSTSSGSPDLVTWITPTSFVTFANIAQVGFRRAGALTVMEGEAPGFSFPTNQLTHRFYNRGGGFSSGNADGIGMSFLGIGTWK